MKNFMLGTVVGWLVYKHVRPIAVAVGVQTTEKIIKINEERREADTRLETSS